MTNAPSWTTLASKYSAATVCCSLAPASTSGTPSTAGNCGLTASFQSPTTIPRAAATTKAFIHGQAPWWTSTSRRVSSQNAQRATLSTRRPQHAVVRPAVHRHDRVQAVVAQQTLAEARAHGVASSRVGEHAAHA